MEQSPQPSYVFTVENKQDLFVLQGRMKNTEGLSFV